MKRTVPLLITAIAGFVLIISFFLPAIQEWGEGAAIWFDILAALAFILGGGNLLKLHLKSISDQQAGWGYSAVTIVAFLGTLLLGLLKVGSPPTPNVEYYGETFVPFPVAMMPEFSVDEQLPERGDREPVPASVRRQLSVDNGKLNFRGWMSENQKEDLLKYGETLNWKRLVEELFDLTQPENVGGKVKYYADHEALAVSGVLTEELEQQLLDDLPDNEFSQQAVDKLIELTNVETSISVEPPEAFTIPDSESSRIQYADGELTIVGPMSIALRDKIANLWAGFLPALPLTDAQIEEFQTELEERGPELNEEQVEVLDQILRTDPGLSALPLVINSAGIRPGTPKTAGELVEERDSGVLDLVPVHLAPDPVLLNSAQEETISSFIESGSVDITALVSELESLGPLIDEQKTAITGFWNGLEREATRKKNLGIGLLKVGPLSRDQQEFLFVPAAEMYSWDVAVGELFIAAHQVKYPWSGEFSAQGNPFWWTYEYVLQPLMTTTFALLAFYVASAAFRAFRAKNLEATLLLGTAFIVLLGRTYLGTAMTVWIPEQYSALRIDQMTVYIMKIFNTAGNRAIMIGIALGIASTSLKVLLGIDRSYLGSNED
ncbi:hypothetical protein KOR42_35100 [Thalassoglobus neptunius]|uniref:Uncharacterized protein n=1 Tax=Thalassoglobus neptunius TaxID=1938619 RepID=A0A5C5WP69_9PLAN|nr:hypothetical protein [Thalassoglobus neptunius]TWT51622.1 hypothetical protein KOR42_35100 [Thalassoglobus neptunius]